MTRSPALTARVPAVSRGRVRRLVISAVVIFGGAPLAACVTGTGTACAATPASVAAGPATTTARPVSSTVTLVTGDRVHLDVAPDGSQSVAPVPAAGTTKPASSSGFLRVGWGGDQFLIPDVAVPYLGSVLDPRLFDISYLASAKLDDGHSGTLPVRIDATSSAAAQRLPAVHVTKTSGLTATARVTKSQAARLGRLLAARWQASRTGHAAAPAGRLPGITEISLAPPKGAPQLPAPLPQAAAHPAGGDGLHYHTLTLNFIGTDGQPAVATGWVQNVDDARLSTFEIFGPPSGPESGLGVGSPVPSGRISVPDGTYSLIFGVLTPHPGSYLGFDSAVIVKPQVTVNSDTTINFDARTAKPYQATLDPPVTAAVQSDELSVTRSSVSGGCAGGDGTGWLLGALSESGKNGAEGSSLSVTPTAPVSKGSLDFDAMTAVNTTPAGAPNGPRYILDFPHAGSIPDEQTHDVSQAELTPVHEQLYQDPSAAAGITSLFPRVYHPWRDALAPNSDSDVNIVAAGERTDYWYTSDPALTRWENQYQTGGGGVFILEARRSIEPGKAITEAWGKAPSAPSPAAPVVAFPAAGGSLLDNDAQLTTAPAVRQADAAMLYLHPDGDSDPSHYDHYDTSAALRFYRNGQLAASSATQTGGDSLDLDGLGLPLLPDPATYRLEITTADPNDTAATTDTDWTFHSSRADPAAQLAKTELCSPDASRPCSLLPLLFVTYDLALNYHSQAPASQPFVIAFTVGHQQGAPAPTSLSATVSASFDDGKTWSDPQPAAGQTGGAFATTIQHPPLSQTSGYVSLRVHAQDGAGNAVEQTIIRAYALTS